jgi:hypothetical protein
MTVSTPVDDLTVSLEIIIEESVAVFGWIENRVSLTVFSCEYDVPKHIDSGIATILNTNPERIIFFF